MIILTGFGPYSEFRRNVSGEIVDKLTLIDPNIRAIKKILPVSWTYSLKLYKRLLTHLDLIPKLVVLLGIHTSKFYHLENFSWNFAFGKDNNNKFKIGLIQYNYHLCLRTILNVNRLYSSLKNKVNISISYYAGTYLCNYIYYHALSLSNQKYPIIFIHIPYNEEINLGIKKIVKIIETIMSMENNVV